VPRDTAVGALEEPSLARARERPLRVARAHGERRDADRCRRQTLPRLAANITGLRLVSAAKAATGW
jgi:hypothetical protein